MNKYFTIKNDRLKLITIDTIFEYIFVISMVFCGGTMYGVLEGAQKLGITSYTFRVITMLSAMMLICVYLVTKREYINRRKIMLMLLMLLILVFYLAITRFKIKPALEGMCIPILLFAALCVLDDADKLFVKFFEAYDNVAIIVGIISVVFYFAGPILGIIDGKDILYSNYDMLNTGKSYYYLFFVNDYQVQSLLGHEIVRNIGIFMEAPSFANLLIFALFWELFYHEGKRNGRILILGITLVTTLSTKAFLFGFFLVAAYVLFVYGQKNTIIKSLRKAIIPITLVFGTALVAVVLIKKSATSGSMSIRLDDTYAAFKVWLSHPLFGAGFYNMEAIYDNYRFTTLKGDPTAGLVNILAYGGIYMFVAFLVCFMGLIKKLQLNNKTTNYVFAGMFLGMLFISAMQYSYITLFILAVGLEANIANYKLNYKNKDERKKDEREQDKRNQYKEKFYL